MPSSSMTAIVFGDMILVAILIAVVVYVFYLFWKRCQKDRIMIQELRSNQEVVPAELVINGVIQFREPQVPSLDSIV